MNRFDDVREFFTEPRLLSVYDEPERFGAPIINTSSSILMPGCGNSPFCMYHPYNTDECFSLSNFTLNVCPTIFTFYC